MRVHVSIHDVSPASKYEFETALAMCHAAGARPSLLVVPNFHHRAALATDPSFCGRLRALQKDGHEIFLHGFFHQSSDNYDPSNATSRWAWLFAQRVASGGEAEMSDVSESEGRRRIEEGERVLSEAGLTVDGFVAPAWSMPHWLLSALAERGYRFTEDHWRVYDPAADGSRRSVVLNWATRTPARLASSVVFCRVARRLATPTALPVRIAIHPGDMRSRLVRSEVEATLAWAKGHFIPRSRVFFASFPRSNAGQPAGRREPR
jgi:hypothetical protein